MERENKNLLLYFVELGARKGIFEMIHKAFKFGFGQGMKYQKKRGKVNKNGK